MISITKKYIIVCMLTLLTAGILFKVENFETITNERLGAFPKTIGGWQSENVPMEPWVFESLETSDAIMRNYSKDDQIINLAIVWYSDKEIAFHAPEACFGGIGKSVKEKRAIELNSGEGESYKVTELKVEQQNYRSLVYYYFINEGEIVSNQIELRAMILSRKLKMQRTSAAFVRIMTSIMPDQKNNQSLLHDFFFDTLPSVMDFTMTRNTTVLQNPFKKELAIKTQEGEDDFNHIQNAQQYQK